MVAKSLETVSIQRHMRLLMGGGGVLKRPPRMFRARFVFLLAPRFGGAMGMRSQVVKFGGALVVLVV